MQLTKTQTARQHRCSNVWDNLDMSTSVWRMVHAAHKMSATTHMNNILGTLCKTVPSVVWPSATHAHEPPPKSAYGIMRIKLRICLSVCLLTKPKAAKLSLSTSSSLSSLSPPTRTALLRLHARGQHLRPCRVSCPTTSPYHTSFHPQGTSKKQ